MCVVWKAVSYKHAEMEAMLLLLLLCSVTSTIREAFGFSGAALAEVQASVLWLRRHSEATCDICLLVYVRAEASWSDIQQKCNVMAPNAWIVVKAFGHEGSRHGGGFFTVQKQKTLPSHFCHVLGVFLDISITDCSS